MCLYRPFSAGTLIFLKDPNGVFWEPVPAKKIKGRVKSVTREEILVIPGCFICDGFEVFFKNQSVIFLACSLLLHKGALDA